MAKGTTFSNDLLTLIYNGTPIANLADNAATAPLTTIYFAAHTQDPGPTSAQDTSQVSYTGYTRAAKARSSAEFACSAGVVSLINEVAFGLCTAGVATATHWSTGAAATGPSKIFHRGVFGSRQGPFTAKPDDTITIPGHTFQVDDRCCFYAPASSALPAGITSGVVYFVKTASGNDITISLTQGGGTLDITAAGDGLAYRVTPIAISAGFTPKLAPGQIIVEE